MSAAKKPLRLTIQDILNILKIFSKISSIFSLSFLLESVSQICTKNKVLHNLTRLLACLLRNYPNLMLNILPHLLELIFAYWVVDLELDLDP